MSVARLTFHRKQRIRQRRDFERLAKSAPSASDRHWVVYVDANDLDLRRLGLSVGRRIGGAVQRNRVKRVLRESFRLIQHDLPPGIDLLIVAKPGDAVSVRACQEAMLKLVRAAHRRLTTETQRRREK